MVVGPDGSLIRTVGGQGEGPGEFDNVTAAIVGRDGSYTVMGFRRPSGRRVAGKEPRVCGKAGHRVERDRDRLRADHAPWVDAARPTESKTVD